QARDTVRCYQPLTIVTDKAHSYAKVIGEINGRLGPDSAIRHVDRKYLNNRIESDHAALKQRLRPMRGFQTLAGAKAALAGIETFRTIRKGQFENCETGVINEIAFIDKLFQEAA
ncbi:DDE-type integrase/transposase/recombinase, partial [Leisingera sp. D0M16]|uniref:DDE-type integrase/transposase/recombinase n=1 Tax=Leisingera coralii TaxID=3351347 RepID=UPI003B7EB1D0